MSANPSTPISPFSSQWRSLLLPWSLTGAAWLIIIGLKISNHFDWLDHDYLLRRGYLSWPFALSLFLLGWQVMLLATMLPSSFTRLLIAGQSGYSEERSISGYLVIWLRQGLFWSGYATIWTAFALLAFVADTGLHRLVAGWQWLGLHSWLIGVMVLAGAGLFQFLPLKKHCLKSCSSCIYDAKNSGQVQGFYRQGLTYGLICLGSCWFLMLVMIALGMQSVLTMALLTMVMVVEKELIPGRNVHVIIGFILLFSALMIAIQPII